MNGTIDITTETLSGSITCPVCGNELNIAIPLTVLLNDTGKIEGISSGPMAVDSAEHTWGNSPADCFTPASVAG